MRLRFPGKSGKGHDVAIDDPRLARLVRKCQELPGQVLFQYLGEDDVPRPLRSSEVNDYLRDVTGLEATAKTFRTWSATVLAAAGLAALPAPTTVREGRRVVTEMLSMVSSELNNTPAVCRRSYIHPEVIERYLDGNLRALTGPMRRPGAHDCCRPRSAACSTCWRRSSGATS